MEKPKLCYMDTDDLIVYIKTKYIYVIIAADFETRLSPRCKCKKVFAPMKDILGGKIITVFSVLRSKAYIYIIDDGDEQNAKSIKKFVIKQNLKCKD